MARMLCLVLILLTACGHDQGKDGKDGAPGAAGDKGKKGKDAVVPAPEVKECSAELFYPNDKKPYVMSYQLTRELDKSAKLWWSYVYDAKTTIFSYHHHFAPGKKVSYGHFQGGALVWHLAESDKGEISLIHAPTKKVYALKCK